MDPSGSSQNAGPGSGSGSGSRKQNRVTVQPWSSRNVPNCFVFAKSEVRVVEYNVVVWLRFVVKSVSHGNLQAKSFRKSRDRVYNWLARSIRIQRYDKKQQQQLKTTRTSTSAKMSKLNDNVAWLRDDHRGTSCDSFVSY